MTGPSSIIGEQGAFLPERELPCDLVVKPVLLLAHFTGFSLILGAFHAGREPQAVCTMLVVASGLLLIARELYKEGWIWLRKTEGVITAAKLALLAGTALIGRYQFALLVLAVLLGVLTSHLPKRHKERVWFDAPRIR